MPRDPDNSRDFPSQERKGRKKKKPAEGCLRVQQRLMSQALLARHYYKLGEGGSDDGGAGDVGLLGWETRVAQCWVMCKTPDPTG